MEPPQYLIAPELVREAFTSCVSSNETEIVSLDEASLSALLLPNTTPTGFLFVDIDDLVGDLSASLQALQYPEPIPTHLRRNNHDYGEGMFFDDEQVLTKQALIAYIKESPAGMQPVANIDAIRSCLEFIRAQGTYVTFITAATPGSELPTINNFLGRYFKDACDGVVIASGDYRVTDKGVAARSVINFVDLHAPTPLMHDIPVVSIDDWPRHLRVVREAVSSMPQISEITTIQYNFPSNQEADSASEQYASSLDCFVRAANILTDSRIHTR